jgi:hypothetical protein
VKAVVRCLSVVLLIVPFIWSLASAGAQVTATAPIGELPQYTDRWDLFGGVQYSHFNPSAGRNFPSNSLLGWNGTATINFRPFWGIEAGARGLYGTMNPPTNEFGIVNPKMSENLFLFGPNFRLRRRENYAVGVHLLIGAAYGSFDKDFPPGVSPNQIGVYNNKLAFGAAFGAFYDYHISPRLSARVIADWQPTRYGYTTQNEFAGAVGVVYKIGSLHK